MNAPPTANDEELIEKARCRDLAAFESLVHKYQNLLCAVAYSRCGDFATSEDVAQEAFCIAWNSLDSLREPSKLAPWLCGIVRNLAADATRWRRSRREERATDEFVVRSADQDDPAEAAISREEESLVWDSLEKIPETYREPLVLFYREERSVAEVALALGLSEDAVKQRLSRGRSMLRERVASLVEGTLRRSRPTIAFTMAVMAGLTASATSKSALASGSTVAASTVLATAAKTAWPGVFGTVGGILIGLFGNYLGLAIPAHMAPTRRERDFMMRAAKRTTAVSFVLAALMLVAAIYHSGFTNMEWLIFVLSWVLGVHLYLAIEVAWIILRVKRIRQETPPESDPNLSPVKRYLSPVKRYFDDLKNNYEPRHYRSSRELLGIPLLHINGKPTATDPDGKETWTVGWIAIGVKARGLIAIGGLAQGLIAIGSGCIGLISIGGLAFGVLSLGGVAIGALAVGGMAVGWDALGGAAIAWRLAAGGAAYAWHSAFGGLSIGRQYAVGGYARAIHANDEIAHQVLSREPLVGIARSLSEYSAVITTIFLIGLFFLIAIIFRATIKRKVSPS